MKKEPCSKKNKGDCSIKVVERALEVLEVFGKVDGDIRISTLSKCLGIEKPYLHRLLTTFVKRGYVEQCEETSKYRLGVSAYELMQKYLSRMNLLNNAMPFMKKVANECNEAVYLAIPSGSEILMFSVANSTQVITIAPLVGNIYPLRQTSAGMAMKVSNKCIDTGGFGDGSVSMAVPLFGMNNEVQGSICIVGPMYRFSHSRIETELFPLLEKASANISARLGCYMEYKENLNYYLASQDH